MNQNINPKTLKGKEVFNRTLELMNKLTPINESVINSSLEFVKKGPNGLVYTIIRENHKYFIKSTDKLEFKVSELDYIGGLKNKMSEAYSSYEEALKHLNMKFQELNELYDVKGGYNLFEQDVFETEEESNEETGSKEKKYKLKLGSEEGGSGEEMPEPSMETPTSEEMPATEEPTISDVPTAPEGEESLPSGEEMPSPESEETSAEMGEELPAESDDEEDMDIDEEEDPKKYIQKLTGRLGQKLRELSEVDPKLEKYVINSIISALHIDKMDKKDRMDVIRKFKKKKGMESIMKESYSMDEYYGMMSLEGPFNYEKIKGGFDEDHIMSHPKKHKPLNFKKYELDMDEELIGGQKKLDLNKNGKLDAEDFKMLRSKKKDRSSDEQWQSALVRAAIPAVSSYIGSKLADKDESLESYDDIEFHSAKDETLDRKERLKNALERIREKRSKMKDMDEMDINDLFKSNRPEREVADPDIDIDEPLVEPTPRVPDPFDPGHPDDLPMPGPKMEKDYTFESIIEKYKVKK
jgi:hypothetical protein